MALGGILGGAGGGAVVSIIIKAIDNYSKEFKKLDKGIKKQETGFKKLGKMLSKAGLGYIALAGAAVAFSVASIKTAAKAEQAFQQFNLRLGETADLMLTDLRIASRGMVSDFELVNSANRALALGISKNQLPELMAVATARAKVFGRTTTDAFNDITIGIGRQSRMILDNLGIILDMDKVYTDYAASVDKSADALSEFEKKQALTNAIITQTEPLMLAQILTNKTSIEGWQQLTAAVDNFKQGLGETFIAQKDLISGTSIENELLRQQIDEALGATGAMDETATAIFNLGDEMQKSTEKSKGLLNELKNIKDFKLEGETAKDLEIAQSKVRINKINLALMKEGEERQKALNELGIEQQTIMKEGGGSITMGGVSLAIQALEEEESRLEILRQEKLVNFEDEKMMRQAINDMEVERIQKEEISNAQFQENEDGKIQSLKDEGVVYDTLDSKQKALLESMKASGVIPQEILDQLKKPAYEEEEDYIQKLIDKTDELIEKYKEAGEAKAKAGGILSKLGNFAKAFNKAFTEGVPTKKVGDAIIRPNGEVIETDPRDTLIATKGGMGMGVNIYIDSVYGMDPEELSKALSNEISTKVSL